LLLQLRLGPLKASFGQPNPHRIPTQSVGGLRPVGALPSPAQPRFCSKKKKKTQPRLAFGCCSRRNRQRLFAPIPRPVARSRKHTTLHYIRSNSGRFQVRSKKRKNDWIKRPMHWQIESSYFFWIGSNHESKIIAQTRSDALARRIGEGFFF
jgi:hypothetical protein